MPRQPSWKPLPLSFFTRPTVEVARDLLGKALVRRMPEGVAAGRIVEVEAYLGEGEDPASHAHRGPRGRAAVMFERGGIAYVYLSYGVHRCANVVTGRRGEGGAVLIRALEPLLGEALMRARRGVAERRALASGPGKLTQALAIGEAENGACLRRSTLIVAEGPPPARIEATPRIGITRAADWPLRFVEAGSAFLSR
jgi:DNA-3-methyladenine glycosylase